MILDVVGCGAVTRTYHLPVLRYLTRVRGVTVRGCYDIDPAAAAVAARFVRAHRHGGLDAFPSPEAQAVVIATPPDSHADIARRALNAGKHVFIEKPFVTSAADARDLLAMAGRARRRVLVGHFRRLYPSLEVVRRFLAVGGLGQIRRVDATEGARWEWPAATTYFLTDPHGGVLWDTGSHVLDMLLYALSWDSPGVVVRCHVQDLTRQPAAEPAHEFNALAKMGSGEKTSIDVRLHVSRIGALAGALKFYGDNGVLILPTTFASAPSLLQGGQRFAIDVPHLRAVPATTLGCFVQEHEEFLGACADGDPSVLDAQNFTTLIEVLTMLGAGVKSA